MWKKKKALVKNWRQEDLACTYVYKKQDIFSFFLIGRKLLNFYMYTYITIVSKIQNNFRTKVGNLFRQNVSPLYSRRLQVGMKKKNVCKECMMEFKEN